MSKIDLSKAKIGDKFRDRDGCLHELIYILKGDRSFLYLLVNEQKNDVDSYLVDGSYKYDIYNLDLVEQVFDEPLDTKERDIRTNYEMEKVVEVIDEKKQELQRRQEVVEVANELFKHCTIKHGKTKETYLEWIFGWAENFVYTREKYLNEGKL